MDLWYLKPGRKIRTHEGAEAEVLSESEDGEWVRVRYLDTDDPLFGETEDLAHKDEIESLIGVLHSSSWGDKVTVMLHHVPETEEYEGGYEAVTMAGIPHGVLVTGTDLGSARGALTCLIDGLRTFGFSGYVVVEDATDVSQVNQYEIWVSKDSR